MIEHFRDNACLHLSLASSWLCCHVPRMRVIFRRWLRSVLDVASEMSQKRTDAALLFRRGRLVGIVTDHDLTRFAAFYIG